MLRSLSGLVCGPRAVRDRQGCTAGQRAFFHVQSFGKPGTRGSVPNINMWGNWHGASIPQKKPRFHRKRGPALTAFVGFGCSFGAKWFGGYARNGKDDNYALRARNGLLRKMASMQGVGFVFKNYVEWNPPGMLIYCGPPYKGTTGYNGVGAFDHDLFWSTMREWSKSNSVYVSEYTAPENWECIWEQSVKLSMHDSTGGYPERIEKIFRLFA